MSGSRGLFVVVLLASWGTVPAAAGLLAARIDPTNASRTIVGGPDAIGGLGDWALQNGTLCAVLADPSHESNIAVTGGGLIDLGLCGRDDDQFLLYQELLNNSLADAVPTRDVTAAVEEGVASLLVRGGRDGITVATRHLLDTVTPRRLRIETRVTRTDDAPTLYGFAGALANVRGLTPYLLSLDGSTTSRGYVHPTYTDRGPGAIPDAASPADLVIAVGAEELRPGIAYGQRFVGARLEGDGEPTPVPHFFLADGLATVLATFARPFWIGDGARLGWTQMLQTRLMDLEPGLTLVLEQEIWVGDRRDPASVTDLLWSDAPLVRGHTTDGAAVVHVERPSGEPVTQVRVDAKGVFRLRLPPGDYRLRAAAPGGREVEREVSVGEGDTDLGPLDPGAPARIALPASMPMRLVFLGIDGSADPDFHDDLRGYRMIGDDGAWSLLSPERDLSLTGGAGDPSFVTVAPGRYRVLATRGPEFSLTSTELEVAAGETVMLAIEAPIPVVETPGWISSDFHIHSAASLDNPTAPERRVASYLAQGAEVLVSSEHDNVFDFAPVVGALGLSGDLASLVGLEVTSEVRTEVAPYTIGHANVFPMLLDPVAPRKGAVDNEGRRWREVIADVRALEGERVIQLDHARFGDRKLERRAFLSHMGPAAAPFERGRPLSEAPNDVLVEADPETGFRDLDFDAMELLNGPHMESYEQLREDWFAFLRQGERIVGTANSDSHFLSSPVASPRNYVRVASDSIADFDARAFVRAVLEGRLYGTTGPILDLSLGKAGLGDTFRGEEGTLRGTVHAASWVSVSEIRVYVSGRLTETLDLAAREPFEIPLVFDRDAFVTVEIVGEAGTDFAAALPGFVPFAFTNPIFVDADGDGEWTPPGL